MKQETPTPTPESLYKKREPIHPKLVFGKYRAAKWAFLFLALAFYYILPWIRWDRGPNAPDQAVLADFAGSRFYFFGLEIWPQEVYYITGLLILASLALFLVTSLFGRVWCGYACPQTVWTDLYIAVERFFEGDRNARIKLSRAPLSFNKIWRKTAKHIVWLLIALATGGAFVFYWHDAPTLVMGLMDGTAETSALVFAAILTFTTYALAGTMREQVCTYLCPWPRIQAALTDEHALNVTYKWDRGEPRGAHKKGTTWDDRGDCVDCSACVIACPMGIDIREGSQLECIHCALCIDACDQIMQKVERPTGLIGYDTETNVSLRANGEATSYRFLRPRVIVYALLMVIVSAIMLFGLSTRSTFELNILKDRSPPFVRLSTGQIQNGYTLKLINKESREREVEISVDGHENLDLVIIGNEAGDHSVIMTPEHVDRFRILIKSSANRNEPLPKRLRITTSTDTQNGKTETQTNSVFFASPQE